MASCEIMEAAASGDLGKLRDIKEKIGDERDFGRNCDLVCDVEGRRVLHYAAAMGRVHICRFFIEEIQLQIDIKTHKGDTPLLIAVREGQVSTAKYLINKGAQIATSDSKGFTPLHYAAQTENKELMKLLLIKGADIEADSVAGTPLQCAALCGSGKTVKFLLDHGVKPNSFCELFGCTPLTCAIISCSFECMELLLKAGADPNMFWYGLDPLALAAIHGQPECLKPLLAAGADPDHHNSYGMRPFEHAALARNLEGVRILFPVTPSLPGYPDWSIDGIMEFENSEAAEQRRQLIRRSLLNYVKGTGKLACSVGDYFNAVKWYSEAMFLDPYDEKILSNRSLCWARLGKATFALRDAEQCVRLKPDWAKAHYREGAAWKLLGNKYMSSEAFRRASDLDPQNDEIENAYRESLMLLPALGLD